MPIKNLGKTEKFTSVLKSFNNERNNLITSCVIYLKNPTFKRPSKIRFFVHLYHQPHIFTKIKCKTIPVQGLRVPGG